MENWKQAIKLVRFELNYSKYYLFVQLALIIFLLYVLIPAIPGYFDNSILMLDILLFLITISLSQLVIPKPFKVDNLNDGRWASHFTVLLNQLAISKDTIVKYRFLSYSLMTLPFSSLFLLLLYLLSPFLQNQFSVSTYIVFSIFWLCFSLYVGGSQISLDPGYNLILSLIITFLLIGPIVIVGTLFLFYFLYPNGFVQWTLMISERWPLQTVIISIILAFIGCKFWMKRMEKRMKKIDYFS